MCRQGNSQQLGNSRQAGVTGATRIRPEGVPMLWWPCVVPRCVQLLVQRVQLIHCFLRPDKLVTSGCYQSYRVGD